MMKRNDKGYGWKKENAPRKGFKLDTQGCKLQKLEEKDIVLYSDKSANENEFLVWMISHPSFLPTKNRYVLDEKEIWYYSLSSLHGNSMIYLYKNNILRIYEDGRQVNLYTNIPEWKMKWEKTIGQRVGKNTGIL